MDGTDSLPSFETAAQEGGLLRMRSLIFSHALFADDDTGEGSFDKMPRPHVRRCGSTMSRKPSPRRLKQNTEIIRAAPGKNAIHHLPLTMSAAPSATMMPHSAVGGRTPRPMKERPAALRIAYPSVNDTCTIISGMMFGNNC